jgi:hypothetical protein
MTTITTTTVANPTAYTKEVMETWDKGECGQLVVSSGYRLSSVFDPGELVHLFGKKDAQTILTLLKKGSMVVSVTEVNTTDGEVTVTELWYSSPSLWQRHVSIAIGSN